ncbi:hypothetical protein Q427_11945 [Halomonas sp. BC04]|nr:hypothetical protein Q427_11945 [Halomonas sp. BC04]
MGILPKQRICTTLGKNDKPVDGYVHGARFLPYPVEVKDFSLRERTINLGDRVKLLCVGSLTNDRKRPWMVLEAIALAGIQDLVDVTFIGLGNEESTGAQKIAAVSSEMGFSDFSMKYNIPHHRMYDLYKDYDVLVHPARKEPFGMVVLEAMAAGLALITSDEVRVSSCLGNSITGFTFKANKN